MADTNLFEDMKAALQDFKDFLDTNVPVIKPAVQALADLGLPINELVTKLVDLMNLLKAEINKLNVSAIPGLAEASQFTGKITNFLTTAKSLVPDVEDEVQEVLDIAGVVSSLPSLEEIKAEIISLMDAIIGQLNTLKTA